MYYKCCIVVDRRSSYIQLQLYYICFKFTRQNPTYPKQRPTEYFGAISFLKPLSYLHWRKSPSMSGEWGNEWDFLPVVNGTAGTTRFPGWRRISRQTFAATTESPRCTLYALTLELRLILASSRLRPHVFMYSLGTQSNSPRNYNLPIMIPIFHEYFKRKLPSSVSQFKWQK